MTDVRRVLERRVRAGMAADAERAGGLDDIVRVIVGNAEPRAHEAPVGGVGRSVQIDDLRTWQSEAVEQLRVLIGGDRVEAVGLAPFPAMGEEVTDATKVLIGGMSQNMFEIALLEALRLGWQAAANAVREAVRLRADTALQATGQALAPEPRQHLLLMYATFMMEGNTPRLRQELDDARQRMPDSPDLAYWSAHYHIIVGEHAEAQAAIQMVPNEGRIRELIWPILTASTDAEPEKVHPSNFYTYRYDLVSETTLEAIMTQFAAIRSATVKDGAIHFAVDAGKVGATAAGAGAAVTVAAQEQAVDDRDVDDFEIRGGSEGWFRGFGGLKFDRAQKHQYDHLEMASTKGELAADKAMEKADQEAERIRKELQDQAEQRLARWKQSIAIGQLAMEAFSLWHLANRKMRLARYPSAKAAYNQCQAKIREYMGARYPLQFPGQPLADPVSELGRFVKLFRTANPPNARIKAYLLNRHISMGLTQLYELDWVRPAIPSQASIHSFYEDGLGYVLAAEKRSRVHRGEG